MKKFIEYCVEKPISVLMSTLVLVVLGVLSLTRFSIELFPEMEIPYVLVMTTYEGGNPEQVEEKATIPVENSLKLVSNFKSLQSTSSEHFSMVFAEFEAGTNMDTVLLELSQALDIAQFDSDVDRPVIMKLDPSMTPVYVAAVSRTYDDLDMETQSEEAFIRTSNWLKNEVEIQLESIEGVANVELTGSAATVLQVDLDDSLLHPTNPLAVDVNGVPVTKDYVLNQIKTMNLDKLAGIVMNSTGFQMLYIGDAISGIEELKTLPIYHNSGTTYTLEDLEGTDGIKYVDTESSTRYSKVNGQDTVRLSFFKQSGSNVVDTGKSIQSKLDSIAKEDNATFLTVFNQAEYIDQSIGSVVNNLIIGGILAIIILFIFLRDIRPTIYVGLAIPLSVVGSFTLMYFFGLSLNIISMGGLALGIGMLVDNSIVVIENIYRHINQGMTRKEAAIYGASRIAGAITASTITTVCVFLPVVFIDNMIVDVFNSMALTVAFSLLSSLVIALSIVPTLAASSKQAPKVIEEKESKFKDIYKSIIRWTLNHRIIVVLVVLLTTGLALAFSTVNGVELFPQTDEGTINLTVELEDDRTFADLTALGDEITDTVYSNTSTKIEDIELIFGQAGIGGMAAMFSGGGSSTTLDFTIMLKDNRKNTTNDNSKLITELLDKEFDKTEKGIKDISSESSNSNSFMQGGDKVTILGSQLPRELDIIAQELITEINKVDGVLLATSSVEQGAPITTMTINKENAVKNGVTSQDVIDSIELFYRGLGFSLEDETDTGLIITDNGLEYEIKLKQEFNLGGTLVESAEFLSMIPILNNDTITIANNAMDEDPTLKVIDMIDIGGGVYVPMLNPTLFVQGDNTLSTTPTADPLSGRAVQKVNEDIETPTVAEADRIVLVEDGYAADAINRNGKLRLVNINIEYKEDVKTNEVAAEIQKVVDKYLESDTYKAHNSGTIIEMSGESEDLAEVVFNMVLAVGAAILLVYMVMAIQFQSLKYPFIVLFTIPLAFTGGILALLITGLPMSVIAIVGLIVLVGIIVNNGIVLIDYINKCREKEMDLIEACIEASVVRLRPILMTAATTSLALLTMAIGIGEGSELLQPLAITAIGGLVYATLLTLVVVPVMYAALTIKNTKRNLIFLSLLLVGTASAITYANIHIIASIASIAIAALSIMFTVLYFLKNSNKTA